MHGGTEANELRDVLRRFCKDNLSSQVVRAAAESETGTDLALWRRLCNEVGVADIRVPEGGIGFGDLLDVTTVVEELGRAVAPVPVLSTVVTTELLLRCKSAVSRDLLAGVGSGDVVPVLSRRAAGSVNSARDQLVVVMAGDGGARVSGRCDNVLDGMTGTHLVLAADVPDGVALLVVPLLGGDVTRRERGYLDGTRRRCDFVLDQARASVLETGETASRALETVALVGALAVSADSVGGMSALLDRTTEHLRTRYQFGRPIGSFQAVKHMAADLLVSLELGRSLELDAGRKLSELGADVAVDDADARLAVAMAKSYCSDAYQTLANVALQLHGGMGYTWEHDCHLYLRRAKTNRTLWGSPQAHRREIARMTGLTPGRLASVTSS